MISRFRIEKYFFIWASSLSDETSRVCVCVLFSVLGFLLLLIDSFFLVIIIMIIIIKQTLIGNIYKVTKERCGHAHITTVGVAPFTKRCVLLWIFPLWVLPSASFSSSLFFIFALALVLTPTSFASMELTNNNSQVSWP